MINLPAAPAAAPSAAGPSGLPPPSANTAVDDSAPAGALLDVAVAIAPTPFGALLDAMADAAGAPAPDEDGQPGQPQADSTGAAAQAAATLLPAMGSLPLPLTPGATPGSVAAVTAALAGALAGDASLPLRQPAPAVAQREAAAGDGARAQDVPAQPDARLAILATAARAPAAALPAVAAAAPAPLPAPRSSAGEALSAALHALQGQAADSTAAPLAAKDSASLLADSQPRQPADAGALPGFRSVLANAGAAQPGEALVLNGSPEQWQQPLRAALGDRLQLQLARNDERAVIRLEPPNMGSVEISVRHSGGALQVNIAASHNEVLRQLNAIGDTVRQDLAQRQLGEVAVTVSSSNARSLAEGGQQQRQQQSEQQRQPGRALDGADAGTTTFAMLGERE